MLIYSQRIQNSLKPLEIHGNFHPHFQQKWLVREYYSCGLEYYCVHISEHFHGGLNGLICPIFGIKCKDLYRAP